MNGRSCFIVIVLLLAVSGCTLHPGIKHYSHEDQEYYSGTYAVPQGDGVHTGHDAEYVAKHAFISHLPRDLKGRLLANSGTLTTEQRDALLASVITAVSDLYIKNHLKNTTYRVNVSLDVEAAGGALDLMFGKRHRTDGGPSAHYPNLYIKDEAAYDEILNSGPGPFMSLYLTALQFEYQKYSKDLNPTMDELMEQYPGAVYPYFYLARTLVTAESPDAPGVVDEILRLRPGMAQAHYLKGFLLYMSKEYQAAITSLTKALSLDDRLIEAYYYRGMSYEQTDRHEPAINDLTRVIETGIYQQDAAYYRARAYYETGRFTEAINDLTRHELQRYDYGSYLLFDAYLARGDYSLLIDHYSGKIEEDPEHFYNYAKRAEAYYLSGELEKAKNDFETAASKEQYPGNELLGAFNCAAKLSGQHRERAAEVLRAYLESLEKINFDGLIMKHYLDPDRTSEDDVIHLVDLSFSTSEKYQCYLCKTYYYFGERHLNDGDQSGAENFFQKSLDTGGCCRESFFARGWLRRMADHSVMNSAYTIPGTKIYRYLE